MTRKEKRAINQRNAEKQRRREAKERKKRNLNKN